MALKSYVIVLEQTSTNKRGNMAEPEIEEILEESVATVKILSSAEEPDSDNCDGSILGPTLIAKVQVEDETVDALLDTESPVTILSLNFIANKWAQL